MMELEKLAHFLVHGPDPWIWHIGIKLVANFNDNFHNPTFMTSNLSPGNLANVVALYV